MTKTYQQVLKQIESLRKEADDLKRKEVEGVIARIREAVAAYGLTAADLGLGAKRGRPAATKADAPAKGRGKGKGKAKGAAKAGKPASKVAVKYRDEAGNTWTGRGLQPKWLRAALEAGRKIEDFKL